MPQEVVLIDWWEKKKPRFKKLAPLALRSLHLPVSSVEVERSFSQYSNVVKNPQQAQMSNGTKRGRSLILWNDM